MKRTEKINSPKIIDDKAPLPLVPAWILVPLWFISLALPNLIYSGLTFADTLHIIKWTVTGVPVAIALIFAGARLAYYGPERIKLKLDIFAVIWAVILIYCAVMPFWVNIYSPTGFVLEMTCFATVWVFYVITVSSYPNWGVKPVIILGILNASINIFYAELQSRNMNDLEFLRGTIFADLIPLKSLILPTPGNYIGNTAQQNMFGLWIAISVLGAVYLYVHDVWKNEGENKNFKSEIWLPVLSLCAAVLNMKFYFANEIKTAGIFAVIFVLLSFVLVYRLGNKKHLYYSLAVLFFAGWCSWGLIESTSRSAILALIVGLTLIFLISAFKFDRKYLIRFAAVIVLISTVFLVALSSGDKAAAIVKKTQDIIENYQAIGQRRGIWATSLAMFNKYPEGVGIGQYKWHYLDGQREAFKIFNNADWLKWQYTHWAHNEFLQFFCEAGAVGGVLFLIMYSFWFFPALAGLKRKKEISSEAVWAFALVSVISFAAVFTRPFHRIENMVWIATAFAFSNREFFPALKFKYEFTIFKSNILARLLGVVCIGAAAVGCVYISSGIYGNYLLRNALSTNHERARLYYLEQAEKHSIVYEDTTRALAHYYLEIGEQKQDVNSIAKGFNLLWAQFNREPRSEDLLTLMTFAQRFQIEPVLREIKTLFKPGTYHLKRVPQVNTNSGESIDALLLVAGPGSDDE